MWSRLLLNVHAGGVHKQCKPSAGEGGGEEGESEGREATTAEELVYSSCYCRVSVVCYHYLWVQEQTLVSKINPCLFSKTNPCLRNTLIICSCGLESEVELVLLL